jgi:TIR domain
MRTNDTNSQPIVRAFCSYVHKDNENFGAAIEHMVEDIRAFHEAETGRTLQIFFDRVDIGWGQDLRNAISDSVENATFFIPMLTARYFQSAWCRDELLSFYGKCRSLGVTELILPVVLAGASQIREDSDDELVRIVARVNYIDWSNIWPAGRGSSAWSLGVTKLVRRLVDLEDRVEAQLARTLAESAKEAKDWAGGVSSDSNAAVFEEVDDPDEGRKTVLGQVRDVSEKLSELLTEFSSEFSKELGDAQVVDDYQLRSALDRLAARYAGRGHLVAQEARGALDDLVEYDARARAVVRAGRQIANAQGSALVDKKVVADLRDAALRLGEMIRRVDTMSDGLNRYSNMSVSLRVALSPTRAAVQTLRDIARILDGWLAINY